MILLTTDLIHDAITSMPFVTIFKLFAALDIFNYKIKSTGRLSKDLCYKHYV